MKFFLGMVDKKASIFVPFESPSKIDNTTIPESSRDFSGDEQWWEAFLVVVDEQEL